PKCALRLPSSSRFAAGGAASTSSSTACATSAARGGASSIAPWRTAATRSAGSGDQPSTVAIPARFAWRASEPPIAPRPMMPRVWGRTGWKLAPPHGRVNDEGGPAASPPRDGPTPRVLEWERPLTLHRGARRRNEARRQWSRPQPVDERRTEGTPTRNAGVVGDWRSRERCEDTRENTH